MNIKVLSIDYKGRLLILSDYGEFCAFWGDSELPEIGKRYDVELDIPYRYSLSEIDISNRQQPLIYSAGMKTYIVGKIESYEDQILCLRMDNSIFLIDTVEDSTFCKLINQYVTITTDQLFVYNTNMLSIH